MRNRELIKLLEQYPDDAEVLVRGYESGWETLAGIEERTLAHRVESEPDWIGRWFDPQHLPAEIAQESSSSWMQPIEPATIDRTETVITLHGSHAL